jgi:hypothetical protein
MAISSANAQGAPSARRRPLPGRSFTVGRPVGVLVIGPVLPRFGRDLKRFAVDQIHTLFMPISPFFDFLYVSIC